jgi:methionine synthase II (cobalamin-independent)
VGKDRATERSVPLTRLAQVTATGIGSLPGDDVDAALALVFTELPDLPHLPELPGRGPGADMIGRTAAALVDLPVDLQPSGWRLVPRGGLDEQRARDLLERDIDALVPVAATHDGPLKVQLAGPWTLAATLQTSRGPVLGDPGAVRDVVESFAEGARRHVADVARRAPHAKLVLQIDEPALPAVLAGAVPTASGWGRVRTVERTAAADGLRLAVETAGVPVTVHCCAAEVPFRLLAGAGVAAVSFDLATAQLDRDALGELVDAGIAVWLGAVPALGPGAPPRPRDVAEPVRRLWHELGFAPELLPGSVVLTPACGLAGASEGWTRTALQLVRQAARVLDEAPEGVAP